MDQMVHHIIIEAKSKFTKGDKMIYLRQAILVLFLGLMVFVLSGCPQESQQDGLSIGINEVGLFFIFERRDIGIVNVRIYTSYEGERVVMYKKNFDSIEKKNEIERVLLENQGNRWKNGKDFQYGIENPFEITTTGRPWIGTITIFHKDGKRGETVDFIDTPNLRVELTVKDIRHKVVYTKEAVGENFYK